MEDEEDQQEEDKEKREGRINTYSFNKSVERDTFKSVYETLVKVVPEFQEDIAYEGLTSKDPYAERGVDYYIANLAKTLKKEGFLDLGTSKRSIKRYRNFSKSGIRLENTSKGKEKVRMIRKIEDKLREKPKYQDMSNKKISEEIRKRLKEKLVRRMVEEVKGMDEYKDKSDKEIYEEANKRMGNKLGDKDKEDPLSKATIRTWIGSRGDEKLEEEQARLVQEMKKELEKDPDYEKTSKEEVSSDLTKIIEEKEPSILLDREKSSNSKASEETVNNIARIMGEKDPSILFSSPPSEESVKELLGEKGESLLQEEKENFELEKDREELEEKASENLAKLKDLDILDKTAYDEKNLEEIPDQELKTLSKISERALDQLLEKEEYASNQEERMEKETERAENYLKTLRGIEAGEEKKKRLVKKMLEKETDLTSQEKDKVVEEELEFE